MSLTRCAVIIVVIPHVTSEDTDEQRRETRGRLLVEMSGERKKEAGKKRGRGDGDDASVMRLVIVIPMSFRIASEANACVPFHDVTLHGAT